MLLSRAEAVVLHGHLVADPNYREGDSPEIDALLARLESFIAGSPGHSVRVPERPFVTRPMLEANE